MQPKPNLSLHFTQHLRNSAKLPCNDSVTYCTQILGALITSQSTVKPDFGWSVAIVIPFHMRSSPPSVPNLQF